jgi:hypothetical protein
MTVTDIDDVWFGNIGIVVIEDDLTKERKAYIGVGGGVCKEADMDACLDEHSQGALQSNGAGTNRAVSSSLSVES